MLNEKGATLIEIMIAFVITLFVMLAMMQTALLSMDSNMTNALRDEAVSVAEMRMNLLRNTPFSNLTAGTSSATDTRSLRNTSVTYTTTTTISDLDASTKQTTVMVVWPWKGRDLTHSASTIVRE